MSVRRPGISGFRIASTTLLALVAFLWLATAADAQQPRVGLASTAHAELTNSYQDLVTLVITAPQNGYVALTGSGYLTLVTSPSYSGTVWGRASISIGPGSSTSAGNTETGVEIPFAEGGGHSYTSPFSITTVPNGAVSTWNANSLNLTAVFVTRRID